MATPEQLAMGRERAKNYRARQRKRKAAEKLEAVQLRRRDSIRARRELERNEEECKNVYNLEE